jgi:hypothetical protein
MFSINQYVSDWIEQFEFKDRDIVSSMLKRLEIVDQHEFESDLQVQLQGMIDDAEKVVIVPVRELINEDECYYPQVSNDLKAIGSKLTAGSLMQYNPMLIEPSVQPGSEAIIANIITQLERRNQNKVITGRNKKNPSIDDIRINKCSKLILVEDITASGDQLYAFIKSILLNRTINSWVSGGCMEIAVLCYMSSDKAKSKISTIKQKITFDSIKKYPTFYDLNSEEVNKYLYLIGKYSHKNEKLMLGYGDVLGRCIFSHSVPNSLPAFFWRSVKKWKPNGAIPVKAKEWFALFPGRSISEVLKHEFKEDRNRDVTNRQAQFQILYLLNVDVNINTVRQVSRASKLGMARCKVLIDGLIRNGFLDSKNKITNEGVEELNYLKKEVISVEFNHEYYYPVA